MSNFRRIGLSKTAYNLKTGFSYFRHFVATTLNNRKGAGRHKQQKKNCTRENIFTNKLFRHYWMKNNLGVVIFLSAPHISCTGIFLLHRAPLRCQLPRQPGTNLLLFFSMLYSLFFFFDG